MRNFFNLPQAGFGAKGKRWSPRIGVSTGRITAIPSLCRRAQGDSQIRDADITGQSLPVLRGMQRLLASTTIPYWSPATGLTSQDVTGSAPPPEEKIPTGSEYSSSAATF